MSPFSPFSPIACLSVTGCTTREITARNYRVIRVIDGDTFVVTYDGEPTSVRICGIDAPERSDPDGPAATKALRAMIAEGMVRLSFPAKRKRDGFGRLLARVYVGDKEIGPEMIRQGMAEKYRR